MKRLRSKGLSRRYWVVARTGCQMRRGQNTSIAILGVGQDKSKAIAYLGARAPRVAGSTLLSSLSVLPDAPVPQR